MLYCNWFFNIVLISKGHFNDILFIRCKDDKDGFRIFNKYFIPFPCEYTNITKILELGIILIQHIHTSFHKRNLVHCWLNKSPMKGKLF